MVSIKAISFISWGFLFLSTIFIIIAILIGVNSNKKLNEYTSCTGIIKDFERHWDTGDDSYTNYPVITFTVDGRNYEVVGNYYSFTMHKGDSIEILYDEGNPNNIAIREGLFFVPIVFGIFGSVFLVIAVFLILFKKAFLRYARDLEGYTFSSTKDASL